MPTQPPTKPVAVRRASDPEGSDFTHLRKPNSPPRRNDSVDGAASGPTGSHSGHTHPLPLMPRPLPLDNLARA